MDTLPGPVTSITVIGRRWFDRINGNTYFTAVILVNGAFVHKIEYRYGYGNQYEWDAADWLETNGYLIGRKHSSNGSVEALSFYCHDRNITLYTDAVKVGRKKDL